MFQDFPAEAQQLIIDQFPDCAAKHCHAEAKHIFFVWVIPL